MANAPRAPLTKYSHPAPDVPLIDTIVEANEGDNVVRISQELGSSNPFLDVAGEVVGKVALPSMIVLLTFSLFGVLYLVGRGRRAAVKDRIAEQSSLMSVLGDEADN